MEKRQDIEIIRIICAFGIVWFHTSEIGKDIAYSALSIFIIISMYFSSKTTLKNITILNRAKRLLIPWMFWFLFYGVINIVRQTPFIDTSKGFFQGY